MARKVIDIIYNLVRRRLAQSGAYDRGSGITSLPNSMDVEAGMQQIFKQLKDGGLNPVSADKMIKSEDDLFRVIEEINQKKIRDTEARQKAAQGIERVFDKMRRNIPLNPDDQAALQGSGFKTPLDNFKGFEPKVIQGGKISGIEAMKEASSIIGRKGKYKNMPKADREKRLKELDEIMKEANSKPDDMAGGGLAGALAKLKKKFGKDIIQKGKAPKKSKKKELREAIEGFKKRNMAGGGVAYMLGKGGLAGYGPYQMDKQPSQQGPMGPTFETNDPKEALKEVLARMEGVGIFQAPLGGGFSFDTGVGGRRPIDAGISFNPQDPRFDFQTGVSVKDGKPSAGFQFRMPFADGGMSRRTFLKIMAALASFPVVGKLAKTTKVAKGAAPIITSTAEMPEHFPKLVEKILREGQVVDSQFVKKTGNVKTYRHPDRPDIELTVEGEGDRIQLDFDTDQGMRGGYEFKKGVPDEMNPKPPADFEAGEVKYRSNQDGSYSKDFELGIDTGTENLDEFAGVGKQKTSKSKINLPESDDYADGGLAGLLGE